MFSLNEKHRPFRFPHTRKHCNCAVLGLPLIPNVKIGTKLESYIKLGMTVLWRSEN
jgi:hypothetical protein